MKKALSALLALSIVASTMPAMSVSAAEPVVKLYLKPSKTTAVPGDTITYTLSMEITGDGYFAGMLVGFKFPEALQFQPVLDENMGFKKLYNTTKWKNLDSNWDPYSDYTIDGAIDFDDDGNPYVVESVVQPYLDGKYCQRAFFLDGAGVTSGLKKDAYELPVTSDIVSFDVKVRENAEPGNYTVDFDDAIEAGAVMLVLADGSTTTTVPLVNSASEEETKVVVQEAPKADPESVTAPDEIIIDGCKDTDTISAKVNPDDADQTVTYESDNTAVATVDADGKVTPVSKGVANIISKATKEGVQATTKVTVNFNHALEKTEEVPATCAAEGTKAYWTCKDCGKMFADAEGKTEITAPETIPVSTTHTGTLSKTEAVPATCKADGTEAYWTCSVCGKMYSDAEGKNEITAPVTISKTTVEHTPGTPVQENVVPATCDQDGGYDEVVYCTVCGKELERHPQIEAATGEHKMTPHEKVDATCAAAGSEAYYECSECGKKFLDADGIEVVTNEADLVIPKSTTHTGTIIETPETPATCAAPGEKAHYECSECGKKYLDEEGTQEVTDDSQLVIPVSETHTGELVKTEAVPATCKEDGTEAYWTCSVCGKMYSDAEGKNEIPSPVMIPKTTVEHTPDSPVIENEVPATCGQAGSYDDVVYCTVCGEELDRETKTIDPTGEHDYQLVEEAAPTCTEDGVAAHYECTVCGKLYAVTEDGEPGEEVEAADLVLDSLGGHDWGDWEIVKEATETEDGLKRRVCKRNEEHFEEEVIPATGKQDESSETSSDESVDSTESTESVDSNDSNTDSSKADSSKADTSKAADTSSKAAAAAGTTNPSTGAAAGTMAAGIAVIAALAIVKKKQK